MGSKDQLRGEILEEIARLIEDQREMAKEEGRAEQRERDAQICDAAAKGYRELGGDVYETAAVAVAARAREIRNAK